MANEQNLIPNSQRTPEELREMTRKAGIASGKARREKKTLADALRKILDEPISSGATMTRREAIIANVMRRLNDTGNIKDLKVLAELIGEYSQKIDIENLPTIIQVNSEETAKKMREIEKRLNNEDDKGL